MRILDAIVAGFGTSWLTVADAVAKATLIFLTAGLASCLLRRRSAALRHMIWTLALVGVLILPALSVALPRWQLNLVTIESASSIQLPAPSSFSAPSAQLPASTSVSVSSSQLPASSAVVKTRDHNGASSPTASNITRVSWLTILFGVWAIGVLLIVGRVIAGICAVRWMSRRTERVLDAPWLEQARSLAAELGISSRIVFLRSCGAAMPMAWGLLRPAVLMPAEADHWPAERLRIVLLHELAHVKRRDCLTHMVAQLSCALHWFNPLAWMAARHARTERERACDDLVLAAGTRGPDYADQLIEIARVMRAGRFPAILAGASLAMAHRSELEGRLMAILDPTVPRAGLSRQRTSAAATICALAVLPLAAVQPWKFAAVEEPQPVSVAATQAAPAADPLPTPAASPSPSAPDQRSRRADARATQVTETAVASAAQSAAATAVASTVRNSVTTVVQSDIASAVATGVQTALGIDVDAAIAAAVNPHVDVQTDSGHTRRAAKDAQGKADPRTVAALTAALKDTDKDVRETAMHALVQLRDPGIFDPLVQALSDGSADVREQAAFGLGQLRDRRAVDPLINALKDQNGDVREQAAFALGQIRDRAAVSGLSSALKDADADVREQAVFALGQIRDASSVDAIVTVVHDPKADVRQQAVFALGQIRDRRAVEPLISALKDTDADVREQAAFALGQIRDGRAVEALVIALKDSTADVRQQAAFALGQIRDPRAIDGLTAALRDASADVRQQAAFALGQLAR
jgi:HEAT repeat protein/beta-lactamase regulating signal transducer with metallopeptidase domain